MGERYTRRDALPEGTEYRDEGCDWAPSCLACPFRVCRYDGFGWHLDEVRQRSDVVVELYASGLGADAVAAQVGLSRRTVYRIWADRLRREERVMAESYVACGKCGAPVENIAAHWNEAHGGIVASTSAPAVLPAAVPVEAQERPARPKRTSSTEEVHYWTRGSVVAAERDQRVLRMWLADDRVLALHLTARNWAQLREALDDFDALDAQASEGAA